VLLCLLVPDLAHLAAKGVLMERVRVGDFEQIMARPGGVEASGWQLGSRDGGVFTNASLLRQGLARTAPLPTLNWRSCYGIAAAPRRRHIHNLVRGEMRWNIFLAYSRCSRRTT
jgi:hypothetical protein